MISGFSTNISTYLPPNTDYFERNVKFQKSEKRSHYNVFKDLSSLRRTNILKFGDFKQNIPSELIYTMTRYYGIIRVFEKILISIFEVSIRYF